MTMLLAILLVFSLSWSQQLPVGMTSVTSEPTIEPWIPSEPTTEVPSTVDPTMEIPSTVEPTTEVSVTSEPTTEAPTPILSCPNDSPLTESPIDSVVSIPCDRDQFGDKTYTCILVNSHPEWTLTESTCRSSRPSVGTVDISFRIRFVGLVLSPYRVISSIIRFLLTRHLGIDAQYVTVSRWTDSTRRLEDAMEFDVRITSNADDTDLLQRVFSLDPDLLVRTGKTEEPDVFTSTTASFTLPPSIVSSKYSCGDDFMLVIFNKAEDGVKCQVRVSDAAERADGLVLISNITSAANYCLNPGYYYVGCDGATRVSWTVIPKSITSAGDLKPNTLDLTASPHGAMFTLERKGEHTSVPGSSKGEFDKSSRLQWEGGISEGSDG